MKKINAEVMAGFVILFFSLVFLYEARDYNYFAGGSGGLGPGFFPVWLCGILIVLSLLYIFASYRGKKIIINIFPDLKVLKKVSIILTCMIGFMILLKYAGFIVSSTLFLLTQFYGNYKWYISFGISIVTTLSLYWLFHIVLEIQLPIGLLGW